MSNVTQWLKRHKLAIQVLLDEKSPACKPSSDFWITMLLVDDIAREASATFRSIQGMSLLISQQEERLNQLKLFLVQLFNVHKTDDNNQDHNMEDDKQFSKKGKYFVFPDAVEEFIEGLGSFVLDLLDSYSNGDLKQLAESVAFLVATLVEELDTVVAERDHDNTAIFTLPPVLPKALVQLNGRAFAELITLHRNRLVVSFSPQKIEKMEDEFRSLKFAYCRDNQVKAALDECPAEATFEQAWKKIKERFPSLHEFTGGLATVFPGTATVESDFSVLKWSKDEFCSALTDFALEGVLHAKQYSRLH